MEKRFNIRVYGIWVHDGQLLVNEELIRGQKVIKLPGGGMDWGEGTRDCLRREWKEELGMDITVLDHFYTTDYFQPSAYDQSQVISIYYFVTATPGQQIVNHVPGERTYRMDIRQVTGETFTLPIDKIVGDLLAKRFE